MANENYSSEVRVQVNSYPSRSYPKGYSYPGEKKPNISIDKKISMERAKIRREAIKSENFKEPLIKCPTCGMKMEVGTEECPNCCTKLTKKMDDNKCTILLLIIALLIFFIPFFKSPDENSDTANDIGGFFTEMGEAFDEFMEDT